MPLAWNEIRIRAVASLLADLYDPFTTPPALVKAHQKLDAAVDALYLVTADRKSFKSDAERVAFLFELYQQYTSLLPQEAKPVKPSKARSKRD
jgi:acyl carrier protein phosphodiesterase